MPTNYLCICFCEVSIKNLLFWLDCSSIYYWIFYCWMLSFECKIRVCIPGFLQSIKCSLTQASWSELEWKHRELPNQIFFMCSYWFTHNVAHCSRNHFCSCSVGWFWMYFNLIVSVNFFFLLDYLMIWETCLFHIK